jgi:polyisoprenoid-binding protein YceI
MKIINFAIFAVALTFALPSFANVQIVSQGQGKTEFHAVGHPSLLRINGEGAAPSGKIEVNGLNAKGIVTADLSTLNTGIGLRDEHMKEKYLETQKFPKAELTIIKATLPSGWSATNPQASHIPFEGMLKLHGVEKAVTGSFDVSGNDAALNTTATFNVKMTDFNINVPKYMGISIDNEIPVTVSMSQMHVQI